jgi:hypothetical protein
MIQKVQMLNCSWTERHLQDIHVTKTRINALNPHMHIM